jgi:pimeloyl-ACP methyl ester carboxylesterase
MGTQTQVERMSGAKRRGRRLAIWLGRIAAVLLGLSLLGAGYESRAEAADARGNPPAGQLVDVGGYRLHLNCVGTGSPTVVIEYGWLDSSTPWSKSVQPDVAKTTRVCTYDRAGTGLSEAGPLPRTAERFAQELHTLLRQANIPGPYVLVGHSLGGTTVRVFAHEYPADVAGVVLIESMNSKHAPPAAPASPPETTGHPTGSSIFTLPARIGLLRLLAGPLGVDPHLVSPLSVQTRLDEGQGMGASVAQAGAVTTFGDLPLIVLSRGLDPDPDWQSMQTELLQLSSKSQQRFAEKSGHNIHLDQPEAAVGAIVTMVEQVRGQAAP